MFKGKMSADRCICDFRVFRLGTTISSIFVVIVFGVNLLLVSKSNFGTPCTTTLNKTLEENLKVIQNYPSGDADKYLIVNDANNSKHQIIRQIPVFVTAFDYTHYRESEGLFKSLHERFLSNQKYRNDMVIIVYDLGLTSSEAKMVQRNCKCEFRRFPFEYYPPHVRTLRTYSFKPIIVNLLLMEYDFVWWVDTSVRFVTDGIETAIEQAILHRILYRVSPDKQTTGTLIKNTMEATFQFLKESICNFKQFNEVFATSLVFHADRISLAAVQAWVKCALNEGCIAPYGSQLKHRCDFSNDYEERCHRFDQSVIGIIIRRLFQEQNDNFLQGDLYHVKRGDYVSYFK
ncbi:uncharacterized protein LOC128557917 [Mercenaria mercenaria]|uniref:uncharacterized protein LOC128557917 n=1 Tax=Mercenaria mercenaria TaxID=6596 RepID=UPI00234F2C54|nr:uncharacterized protein LOC128557917 [Mercenaria mercenaria]